MIQAMAAMMAALIEPINSLFLQLLPLDLVSLSIFGVGRMKLAYLSSSSSSSSRVLDHVSKNKLQAQSSQCDEHR